MMVWLNVDIPTKKCTLHRDGCNLKPRQEPRYKGFGELKRDGGWLSFNSDDEAEAYYRRDWRQRGYEWIRCSFCGP